MKKQTLVLIIIFLTALFIRLHFSFEENIPFLHDEGAYDEIALSMLQHREFAMHKGQPTAYITPLYPAFLSAVYFLFGHDYLPVRIIQAFLGSALCLIGYFIAAELVAQPVAVLSFFLMSIHYFFIKSNQHLLSENLFIVFLGLSMLFLIKFCKAPSFRSAAFFGLFCSLGTLTRSAYFLFPFMVIGLLLFFPGIIGEKPGRRVIKFSLVILISCLVPMSVWTARNYRIFKKFVPLGTESGIVLYSAYNPHQDKIFGIAARDEVTDYIKSLNMTEIDSSRYLLKETLAAIKRDPSKIYKYIPLKIMYFFSVFDWQIISSTGGYNFSAGFILPLSFLGIVLAFRRAPPGHLNFILLLPVIYFLLITVAIMGIPRTRLPVEPYLIIFSGFFMNYMYNLYSREYLKIRVVSCFVIWYLLNYLFYLHSGSIKVIARSVFEKVGLW